MSPFGTVLAIVLAFLLGSAVAFYFVRSRIREEAALPDDPAPLADEIRAIGGQIERALSEQRLQGETQRHVLAQKLDGVRQTVDAQGAQVDGLRGELRHEIQRRDQEMAEIRERLAAVPSPSLPPHAAHALPPAMEVPAETETNAPDAAVSSPVAVSFSEPVPADDGPSQAEEPAFEDISFEDISFEEISFGPPPQNAPEEEATTSPFPTASDEGSLFEDVFATSPSPSQGDGMASADVFESWQPSTDSPAAPSSDSAQTISLAAPSPIEVATAPATNNDQAEGPSPLAEAAWVSRPTAPEPIRDEGPAEAVIASDLLVTPEASPSSPTPTPGLLDLDALAARGETHSAGDSQEAYGMSPGPISEPAPVASSPEPESGYEVPEGAEDLTVLSTIDEDIQRRLYLAGVTALEEIAQWSPSDARRIGAQVDVSEATIMNQWVFEAQAALFNRYAQRAGR